MYNLLNDLVNLTTLKRREMTIKGRLTIFKDRLSKIKKNYQKLNMTINF